MDPTISPTGLISLERVLVAAVESGPIKHQHEEISSVTRIFHESIIPENGANFSETPTWVSEMTQRLHELIQSAEKKDMSGAEDP